MALMLIHGVEMPATKGLTWTPNTYHSPTEYKYVAYQQPHGRLWFAGEVIQAPHLKDGTYRFHFRSYHQRLLVPEKHERQVLAIGVLEAVRLHNCEITWWGHHKTGLRVFRDHPKRELAAALYADSCNEHAREMGGQIPYPGMFDGEPGIVIVDEWADEFPVTYEDEDGSEGEGGNEGEGGDEPGGVNEGGGTARAGTRRRRGRRARARTQTRTGADSAVDEGDE